MADYSELMKLEKKPVAPQVPMKQAATQEVVNKSANQQVSKSVHQQINKSTC